MRRRLAFEEVGSTNQVALEAARAGDPGRLWVTAERQAAGRGRRGRTWVSERGNLYASLLLIDPGSPEHLVNLPLVAALGVRNGLAELAGPNGPLVAIKWPNDVLIAGRKSVGILLESERLSDGRMAVVIGCGVNVSAVPAEAPYPVASLHGEGIPASVEAVFDAVAGGVEAAIALWQRGRGFDEVRRGWLASAIGVGEACKVNLPSDVLEGRFEALDETGRLILRLSGGERRAIASGDLFFLDRDDALAR